MKKDKELKSKNKKQKNRNGESVRLKYLRWQRLDNSAHLFPVIAGERMSNTYRISASLTEDVNPVLLQSALDTLLPLYEPFNVRLRKGFFWNYFEENGRKAPAVRAENGYPCRFIHSKFNRDYLFTVSYYKNRINIEVFHVLADGMGGISFLKELVYHYLRLAHPEIEAVTGSGLTSGTSMNQEDSFLRNYKKSSKPKYVTSKAYTIKGEKLRDNQLGVITCKMNLAQLKAAAHKYGSSINEYLVGVYMYSIYRACLHGALSKKDIRIAVPVNLRSYFESVTVKNFFVMISAEFSTWKEDHTFEEIIAKTNEGLRAQMSKDHLESIFSYNVSNQKNVFLKSMPMFLKNIAMRIVYSRSALANSTTMTNIGNIKVDEAYKRYVSDFFAILSMSKGQYIKATICSYDDTMNVTFSSILRNVDIQQCFVKQLTSDGIDISLETNGVYYG